MGDYHRYLAEFATGDNWKDLADKSLEAYKAASHLIPQCCHGTPYPPRTCSQLLCLLL